MNKRLFLSAAAAALIAGTGAASAQGTMNRDTPSATQQAPSSERAPGAKTPMNHGGSSEMKANEPAQPSRAGESNQRAQDNKMQPNRSAQENNGKGDKGTMRSEGEHATDQKNMKAEEHTGKDKSMKAEEPNGRTNAATENSKSKTQTTGQAGAGAKLSTEQRTKITTVIREQKVQPVTNVNFSISVGTRVPRSVHFHPLPTEIVTVYPDWRGYEFFLVRDEIIVVNPQTFEIVAVLEA